MAEESEEFELDLGLDFKLFSDLSLHDDTTKIIIKGTVAEVWDSQKRSKNSYHKKCILTEGNDGCSSRLILYLLNKFAQEAEHLQVGDEVALSGFKIEENFGSSSSQQDTHNYVVILDNEKNTAGDDDDTAKLWIKSKLSESDIDTDLNISGRLDQYEYSTLKEVAEYGKRDFPDLKYNVYGVVLECTSKVARGSSNPYLEVVLSDPSYSKMTVKILGKQNNVFPEIYPQDIVRIHRMKVEKNRQPTEGRCFSPNDVLVFDGTSDHCEVRSTAVLYTFEKEDREMFMKLQNWKKKFPDFLCSISEINADNYVNLLCQVLHVSTDFSEEEEFAVMVLWDGTKPPKQLVKSQEAMDEETIKILTRKIRDYVFHVWVYDCHLEAAKKLKAYDVIEVKQVHVNRIGNEADPPLQLCLHMGTMNNRGIHNVGEDRASDFKDKLNSIIGEDIEIPERLTELFADFSDTDSCAGASSYHTALSCQDNQEGLNLRSATNYETCDERAVEVECLVRELVEKSLPSVPAQKCYEIVTELFGDFPGVYTSLSDLAENTKEGIFRVRAMVYRVQPEGLAFEDVIQLKCNTCKLICSWRQLEREPLIRGDAFPRFECPRQRIAHSSTDSSKKAEYLVPFLELKLLLGDCRNFLTVYLSEENAIKLLQGITPEFLWRERLTTADTQLKRQIGRISNEKREMEMGGNLHEVVPVVDCCLTSKMANEKISYFVTNTCLK